MPSGSPTREQADLAEVLEMVLDKGIVINADIAVTVGQTELLGIEIRAAIASFETAAKYGLAFPSGTDMQRVEQASGRESLEGDAAEPIDLGLESSSSGADAEDGGDGSGGPSSAAPGRRPTPTVTGGDSPDEPVEQPGGDGAADESDDTGDGPEENEEDDETAEADETGNNAEADETDGTDETADGTDDAGEGDGEEGDG